MQNTLKTLKEDIDKDINPKLCGNYAFPQNFGTRKLREIMVFSVVQQSSNSFDLTLPVTLRYNDSKLT